MYVAIGGDDFTQHRSQQLTVVSNEEKGLVDAIARDLEDQVHSGDIRTNAASERIHLRKLPVILTVEQELHDHSRMRRVAADREEVLYIRDHLVEHGRLD